MNRHFELDPYVAYVGVWANNRLVSCPVALTFPIEVLTILLVNLGMKTLHFC